MGEQKKNIVVPITTPEDEAEDRAARAAAAGERDEDDDETEETGLSLDPDEIPDLAAEEEAAEAEFERMRLDEEAEKAAECGFEVARLKEELEKAREVQARALADYQNLEKRMNREVQRRIDETRATLFADLLALVDTLDRAIQAEEQREEGPDAAELRMLRDQLLAAMAKHGVVPMDTAGQPFDPKLHEALGMVPGTDVPSQHVIEEVRRGFMVGDRLLRAAQVVVAA